MHGPENCIIDGQGKYLNNEFDYLATSVSSIVSAGTCCFTCNLSSHNYVDVNSITLRNGYVSAAKNASSFYIAKASGFRATDCIVERMFHTGSRSGIIRCVSGTGHLYNCRIRDIATSTSQILGFGIWYHACVFERIRCNNELIESAATIFNSVFKDIKCNNIIGYGSGSASIPSISNSLLYNIHVTSGILFALQRWSVLNCTFVISSDSDIAIGNSFNTTTHPIIIGNNIFVSSNGKKITLYTDKYDKLSVYNNYCSGYSGEKEIDCLSGTDPGFTDPENGDFHLLDTSPCISAGNYSIMYSSKDLDKRPFETRHPSIGCYQWQKKKNAHIPNKASAFPLG